MNCEIPWKSIESSACPPDVRPLFLPPASWLNPLRGNGPWRALAGSGSTKSGRCASISFSQLSSPRIWVMTSVSTPGERIESVDPSRRGGLFASLKLTGAACRVTCGKRLKHERERKPVLPHRRGVNEGTQEPWAGPDGQMPRCPKGPKRWKPLAQAGRASPPLDRTITPP
jgi:hypothetical protein